LFFVAERNPKVRPIDERRGTRRPVERERQPAARPAAPQRSTDERNKTMKAAYASALALVAAFAAGPAAAEHVSFASAEHLTRAEPGVVAKTREQVRAELVAAQRQRDSRPSDQFGRTVSEAYPAGQGAAKVADAPSREQVRAEALSARQSAGYRPSDQFGRTVSEAYPS
jgi:hypothetical protein